MDFVAEIKRLAEPFLKAEQFIVDVIVSSKSGPKKILVILDGDNGITIDDCAEVSRQLSKRLDDEQLLETEYILEVSTPGVDQPLKLKRQYSKHVGRRLKLRMQQHEGIVEGKLIAVNDESISVLEEMGQGKKKEEKEVTIPFSGIEKAFVLVSFK